MSQSGALYFIRSLQRKWMVSTALSYLLLSLALTLLLLTVLIKFPVLPWWWSMAVLVACLTAGIFQARSRRVSENHVAMYLNHAYPQLEESSGLLLKPAGTLNTLERLQVQKVAQIITQLPVPGATYRKLVRASLVFLLALAVSTALFFVPIHGNPLHVPGYAGRQAAGVKTEKILPAISAFEVSIKPPAYTGRSARTQAGFNLSAEQGAVVRWNIRTTVPAGDLQLLLNGSNAVPLSPLNGNHTEWAVARDIHAPGFYQVKIDGRISEMYSIDMIKDAPPLISIQKPSSYTVIDYGRPQQLTMRVSLEDDYGIRDASVTATTSTGSGEGVKFKEQKLSFTNFKSGGRRYGLEKLLDLSALGMKPGDELYFYVSATDLLNQESRSDVYMISLPDTAQLMSIDGLASAVDIKAEYFRSERQIIIETEQLLKDQKTVQAEAFKTKSNDLGIDQKLLRLRYSKFLGEEEEEENAEGHQPEENNPADFSDAVKALEGSHNHNEEEDAVLLEGSAAKQLRAILGEMWNAETRLRTLRPLEALPYEYKALRLLKDLQERGRSYVAKTSVKTTPLKPEKRLTADLGKIGEPVDKTDFEKKESPEDAIRRALGVLENLKAETGADNAALELLQRAALQLNKRAAAEPAVYLTPLGAMNRILAASTRSKLYSAGDITAAQKGLQRLVSHPAALPGQGTKSPDHDLSHQYFNNLRKPIH